MVLADEVDDIGDRRLVRIAREHALPAEAVDRVGPQPRHLVRPLLEILVHRCSQNGSQAQPDSRMVILSRGKRSTA